MKRLRIVQLSSYSEVAGTTPRDLGRTGVASTGPAAPKRTWDAPEQCYRITDSRTFGHFSGRRFFCCLRHTRRQCATGSPSPLHVALPAPNAPWRSKSMAAFDEHLEGVHPTKATRAVRSTFGVSRPCGAGKVRSLPQASVVPPLSGRCVSPFPIRLANNISQPCPTRAALSAAPVCGVPDRSLCRMRPLSSHGR